MMDIDELRDLHMKLIYQDTLNLDDVGVRDVLQDLVGDEINRLKETKNKEWEVHQLHRDWQKLDWED